MGLLWVAFFNLNGVGPVVFYAGSIFDDDVRATSLAIVFTVFAFACLVGVALLTCVGRKPLMIVNQIIAICGMFGLWFFNEIEESSTGKLICMITYFLAIAFGLGTILFIYLGEICSD